MKRSKLMSALVLGALSLGTAAYAQDRHDGDRHDGGDRIERRGEMNRVEGRGEMHGFERRGEMNRVQNDHRDVDRRDFGRREMGNRGPDRDSYYGHRWQRGERVPPEFRNRQYVVNDWRGHHLHQPRRGYQWVQVGGDYMLVAIATGIIAEMALNQ